jgi:hypothetical protein
MPKLNAAAPRTGALLLARSGELRQPYEGFRRGRVTLGAAVMRRGRRSRRRSPGEKVASFWGGQQHPIRHNYAHGGLGFPRGSGAEPLARAVKACGPNRSHLSHARGEGALASGGLTR